MAALREKSKTGGRGTWEFDRSLVELKLLRLAHRSGRFAQLIFHPGSSVLSDLLHPERTAWLCQLLEWIEDFEPRPFEVPVVPRDDGVLFGIEVCIEVVAGLGRRERCRHRQAPLGIKGHDHGGIIPPCPPAHVNGGQGPRSSCGGWSASCLCG